ncbi:TetR/AcrR family transcriptional regulator [Pseudonocardia sp. CA-107938]|uniref:TetR/AcrR family transcriptional regulator n=1 Tax=Pseudonocardia sp. CA-107938 TaxID=3240021 RepID=UPI003D92EEEA
MSGRPGGRIPAPGGMIAGRKPVCLLSAHSVTFGLVPTRPRAERMRPDERRAAIIDATLPLVLEHGDKVTVRLIAEAARVAEGTIFTVFRDKDELMTAVRERAFDPEPTLRELAAIDLAAPLRERLIAVAEIVTCRLRRVFVLIAALGGKMPQEGRSPEDDEAIARRQQINDAFIAAVVAVIEPDAADLAVSPGEVAHVLRLLAFSATHPLVNDGRPLSAEQIVDTLLDGVRRREPAPTRPIHHDELSTTGGN